MLVAGVTDWHRLARTSHWGMTSGFPEQTVMKRGSLVFCIGKGFETSPHGGREGEARRALLAEGATQAPGICLKLNASENRRWSE
jgi:hypothetical protein